MAETTSYDLCTPLLLAGRDLTDTVITIESGSHYIRDVTLGEDRNHMHTGHAPEVLAALRNSLLALWSRAGWKSMADAAVARTASATAALKVIGIPTLT